MIDFFANNFSSCIWLAVILIALIPTLESKIAIPFAMNSALLGSHALSAFSAFALSLIGSILPCIFVIFLTRHLKSHTTGFVSGFLNRYTVKTNLIQQKHSNLQKYLALAGFVAIPLPLTGVWTGSIIAGLTNLNIFKSFIAIFVGAIVSSGITTLLCVCFENSIGYIFLVSLLLVIIFAVINIVISLFKSR